MEQLLIIRHAIAEERDRSTAAGRPDATRRLTEKGRRRMVQAARGLRRIVPQPPRLISSPFLRARETAQIIADGYGLACAVEESDLLTPGGDFAALFARLRGEEGEGCIALVGHEPALSEGVGWLLTGSSRSVVQLKKGAAALLAFPGGTEPGRARLLWALPPTQLRQLGETL